MNAPLMNSPVNTDLVKAAVKTACDTIAPTWPLDRMIAVNPYWELTGESFEEVGFKLARIAGSPVTMPLSFYRQRWEAGHILPSHLERSLEERKAAFSPSQLIDALFSGSGDTPSPAPLLCDSLDAQRDLHHEPAWCDAIRHQVAQYCAAHFDGGQAEWHPDRTQALYAGWRRALIRDHSVALLMKSPRIPGDAKLLAEDPVTQIQRSLEQLGVARDQWSVYLEAVITRVSGWAAWCAYRRWQAGLAGDDDATLVELLAIRLSWEVLLDDGERHEESIWARWHKAWRQHFETSDVEGLQLHLVWQRAHEISYQQRLGGKLRAGPLSTTTTTPAVQAVFCIDVRSEVFRRHLEGQSADIQTLGFAGFFGLPISYTPMGTSATRPQLPGLLAPAMAISDSSGDPGIDRSVVLQRENTLKKLSAWRPLYTAPGSAFTLVETLGLGYLGKLLKRTVPGTGESTSPDALGLGRANQLAVRPTVDSSAAGGVEGQAALAAQVLRGMNLSEGLAPLVLLVGHGSQSENNPQRAGLDCGACCGQTGEVNSRALASLLNDPMVRKQLVCRGPAQYNNR